MRIHLLGVRGSTPAPGAPFVRYGGHTSCIAVYAAGNDRPTLVLDAGTGIRQLTPLLGGEALVGTLLLSHLHWDHVQGIPFCAAGDRPDARVDVFMPAQDEMSGRDLIATFMSPPAFPITPEGLLGDWSFHAVGPGSFTSDGFDVTAFAVEHKGGATFGYRVDSAGASLAYIPDHAPANGVAQATEDALAGVDLLIHDAQFLDTERPRAADYGHATIQDAVELAERVGAGTLMLFHHGPHRTDEALDRIIEGVEASIPLIVAAEGTVLEVGASLQKLG